VPARFAPEGINVKDAHQTFKTVSTDSFNVIAGALGTNRFAAYECLPCLVFSRSHSGRENTDKTRAEQGVAVLRTEARGFELDTFLSGA
jgi:hypothetical protein